MLTQDDDGETDIRLRKGVVNVNLPSGFEIVIEIGDGGSETVVVFPAVLKDGTIEDGDCDPLWSHDGTKVQLPDES